jgi:hypothetical protein
MIGVIKAYPPFFIIVSYRTPYNNAIKVTAGLPVANSLKSLCHPFGLMAHLVSAQRTGAQPSSPPALRRMLRCRAAAGRIGHVERSTKETSVSVTVNLDGAGACTAASGIPFLDHMLDVRLSRAPPTAARR